MQSLRLQFFHADDVQDEVQQYLIQLESLKTKYLNRLDIVIQEELGGEADVLIIIVWNQVTPDFEEQVKLALDVYDLENVKFKLFVKQAKVAVDLSDRVVLAQQIEQRERLEQLLQHVTKTIEVDNTPLVFDTTEDFAIQFSDYLEQIANQRLSMDGKAMSFRPQLNSTYLERPRLLELLPDSAGYVVWLEAPYGYGKSILAAQWAKDLEEHWRVIWLSLKSGDLQSLLAEAFSLTPPVPWSLLREYLWQESTLLVVEDLIGDEDLSELLKDVQGLLLLASRSVLNSEAVSILQSREHIIHLQPHTLAFSEEETQQLFCGSIDASKASLVWQQTQGWSLPLHFSFLTGELPGADKMVEGIKSSLREDAWQEILFLSALSSLPERAANELTQELASANFVQILEGAYRVHPLAAEKLLDDYQTEIQDIVLAQQDRLEASYFADALFNSQLWQELAKLMIEDHTLSRSVPANCVKWHDVLLKHQEESFSTHYLLNLSWAYGSLGDVEQSIEKLENVVNHPRAQADEIVTSCGYAVYDLDSYSNKSRISWFIEKGYTQLEHVQATTAKLFLSILGIHYADISDFEEAERLHLEAKSYDCDDVYHNTIVDINLHATLWDAKGLLRSYLEHIHQFVLNTDETSFLINFSNSYWFLGKISLYMSDNVQAHGFFQKAKAWGDYNKQFEIVATAELARLDFDAEVFPSLFLQIELLDVPRFLDYIVSLWAQTLKDLELSKATILEVLNKSTGIHAELERLSVELEPNETIASVDLPDTSVQTMRLLRLPLQAKRYLLSKEKAELDALVEMTEFREQMLPGLVPLEYIPQDEDCVALLKYYPIKEVLLSGWNEAIVFRMDDVPDLKLYVLGRIDIDLLEERLELTDRQKQILTLLILNLSREQIAENMWPEVETRKQRNNLNVQLNMLRKVTEPWGVTTYLNEDGLKRVSVDYQELQQALKCKDAAKVIELYQEPFAPGIDLEPINEERERLREEVMEVLLSASFTEDISAARRYLLKVTELEPLHEEALASLLKLLIRQGRRREARQRYSKFATQLKEDLGLEPLEATMTLVQT